jgi:hypothetical protein
MKELLTHSYNQQPVYIDHDATKMALHIQEVPFLLELAKEVLEGCELLQENEAIEKDMGRIVGESTLVETTDADEVIYAVRLGREKYTRFVMNKSAQPTSYVTVILRRADDGYSLWSAWCGKLVPTSPGGDDEMLESQGFWSKHALVYDETIIKLDTLTTTCPWS